MKRVRQQHIEVYDGDPRDKKKKKEEYSNYKCQAAIKIGYVGYRCTSNKYNTQKNILQWLLKKKKKKKRSVVREECEIRYGHHYMLAVFSGKHSVRVEGTRLNVFLYTNIYMCITSDVV